MHAEVNALKKLFKRRTSLPRRGATLTSFRVYKSGAIKCGRPCAECYDRIAECRQMITRVSWSDNAGAFTTAKTNQIRRDSLYVSRGSR